VVAVKTSYSTPCPRRIRNIHTKSDPATDIRSWADVPTAILQSELARRQDRETLERPACGGKNKGSYNTPIHVGALILILTLSTIGVYPSLSSVYRLLLTSDSSVRLSHHRPQIPTSPNTSPIHLPLSPFRNRRSHSYGLRTPLPYCLHISHRPMSTVLLERAVSGYAGSHRHDLGLHSRRHRTILRHARRRTHPQQ
jgi:hypothetical protein